VRSFGIGLILSVAWASSIGGLGTLLGSPPNAIVAGYISSEVGETVGFLQWMMLGVPLVVVFIAVAWLLITRVMFRFDLDDVPGGRAMIDGQLDELGPMSQGEKMVLAVFSSAAFLWVVPPLLSNIGAIADVAPWLGTFDDTVIAIAAGLVLFVIPGAGAVAASGLDEWFGEQVAGLEALPIVLLIAAIVAIVLMLTEVTSNTATAATFIPVLGGVALGIGVDPTTLLIPAALAATCAFMLPVGTPPNAIVFGTGTVKIQEMARGGAVLNVVGVLLITIATVVIGPFALGLVI
jgi:sodium-dependent dicarboxylate transporter 2/3/5